MHQAPDGAQAAQAARAEQLPDPARRSALKAGAGAGLAAIAGSAHAARSTRTVTLTRRTLGLWAAWLDTLVPGAAAAGAAEYLVAQLALPPESNSLFLRYMDWPGSHAAFYRDGLDAVDALARHHDGRGFTALDATARRRIVDIVARGQPEGWAGPPAGLFHFVCKADGADLVFGTRAGIERLGLDYRAHVEPPARWPGETTSSGRAQG